jgi:phytanoyl-CoA hydroxylase
MKFLIEFLRRFKISYVMYNFFQQKKLKHNEVLYKKIGINKRYYSSVSSKDFEEINASNLATPFAQIKLEYTHIFKSTTIENQQSLLQFNDQGFAVLRGFVTHQQVDKINHDIENGLRVGNIKFENKNKIMFAMRHYESLAQLGNNANLIELLSALLKGNPILFQSINFLLGSEQDTHSDSIHMTTFPLGGLLGVWIALEDVDDENGPLHYYAASHKLPYYLNKDYDNEGNAFMNGSKSYDEYEAFIEQKMKEVQLQKTNFHAQKGDLLIWHANLFHGGNKHIDKNRTRKSVVFHYFKEGVICYHEVSQRPALFE